MVEKKPALTVIDGDGIANPRWLDLPKIIRARSPFDPNRQCLYRIAREDCVKAARARRRQPVFEFWSILNGEPPPVPNVERYGRASAVMGLVRLTAAHACFRGIRRPFAEDDSGANILAYVLKPTQFYRYEPNLACVAQKQNVPEDVVFVAYVRMDEPCEGERIDIKGVLTHWGFVEADSANLPLPVDHASRYDERLW